MMLLLANLMINNKVRSKMSTKPNLVTFGIIVFQLSPTKWKLIRRKVYLIITNIGACNKPKAIL